MNTSEGAEELIGKTIKEVSWVKGHDGSKEEEGYGQLLLTFMDNTTYTVNYSCMGGVYLENTTWNKATK